MKDGRPVFVSEVASGLACECSCPECGEELVARNREFPGRKRVRHFQHARVSSCPGGFETVMHRMAKDVVATATGLLLPRWASGDVVIEHEPLAIVASQLEVPMLGGAARPDAIVRGVAADVAFDALCVEIRVHHAVDELKRALLESNGVDTIEIDLSNVDDDAFADPTAFQYEILMNPANRHWIHLANASFVAHRADAALIHVEDVSVSERVIITKTGRSLTVLDQWAFLVKPGSRERVRLQIPDETVGEDPQPYPRGMHTFSGRSLTADKWGHLRFRYKTYLNQIQMNPRQTDALQRNLFEATGNSAGPGFNVRVRDWKGDPGY